MRLDHNIEIHDKTILEDLVRIQNLIFKLLPTREENKDWEAPLHNLIMEIGGLASLVEEQLNFLVLLSKMEALKSDESKENFFTYRKLIFECLTELTKIKNSFAEDSNEL